MFIGPLNFCHFRQFDNYTCAVSSVYMVLLHLNKNPNYNDIYKKTKCLKNEGSLDTDVFDYFLSLGLKINVRNPLRKKDIVEALSKNKVIYVSLKTKPYPKEKDYHACVIYGIEGKSVYLADPNEPYAVVMEWQELKRHSPSGMIISEY